MMPEIAMVRTGSPDHHISATTGKCVYWDSCTYRCLHLGCACRWSCSQDRRACKYCRSRHEYRYIQRGGISDCHCLRTRRSEPRRDQLSQAALHKTGISSGLLLYAERNLTQPHYRWCWWTPLLERHRMSLLLAITLETGGGSVTNPFFFLLSRYWRTRRSEPKRKP
jgi:hypothetical protein